MELVKRQVKACWRDEGWDRDGNPHGKWDERTCGFLLLLAPSPPQTPPPDIAALSAAFADALARWETLTPEDQLALENAPCPVDIPALTFDLGTNPDAVIKRIGKHPKLRVKFNDDSSITGSFDTPKVNGQDSFWKESSVFGVSIPLDSWLLLHRERPELGLLRDDARN
jgi:hypothetical protein